MNRMTLLREQHNLSQTDLARILNISRQSYSFYGLSLICVGRRFQDNRQT